MKRQRGFSLVEIMVAITLALVVTAGVVSVFSGSRSAFQATSGVANLSDSGRFALMFIETAVRDSGFMACGAATRTISNLNPEATNLYYAPGPNQPGLPVPSGLFQPLGGYEAVNTGPGNTYAVSATPGAVGNWNPILDATFATIPPTNTFVANNDVLVVRSSATSGQPVYVTNLTSSNFTVTATGALAVGQLAVISDCTKSLLIQVSSLSTGAPGEIVGHATGGVPGNISTAFPGWVSFSAGAQVTPLQTMAYYIGVGADGDGALYSATVAADNSLTVTELAPDIEAMQILYGVDTTGTQTVSQYVTADQVADFTQVMNVEVAVLAAGPPGSAVKPTVANTYNLFGTSVTAPLDTRVRQVFEVTIAARNALP
jgi:type IV pilus assembly protein PilW